jgi:hypothetical protein
MVQKMTAHVMARHPRVADDVKKLLEKDPKAWGMGHGAWGMGHGAWSMEHGAWSMEHGAWSMEMKPKWNAAPDNGFG